MPGVRSWFRLVWVFERAASCRVCPPRSQIACSGKRCVAIAATHWAPCQWLLISATRQVAHSVLRSQAAPGEHDKHRKFHFQKSYMATAVPLVFHHWSNILLNVGWRCVWLLLLMTKEKQLFHAMQCIYRNCHGTSYTVKSNNLVVSKSAIIIWKVCDHNTPNF